MTLSSRWTGASCNLTLARIPSIVLWHIPDAFLKPDGICTKVWGPFWDRDAAIFRSSFSISTCQFPNCWSTELRRLLLRQGRWCTRSSLGWDTSPVWLGCWAFVSCHRCGGIRFFSAQRQFVLSTWFELARLHFEQFWGLESPLRWGHYGMVSSGRGLNFVVAWSCAWWCSFVQGVHFTRNRTEWACWCVYCNTVNTLQRYWPRFASHDHTIVNPLTLRFYVGSFALHGLLPVCNWQRLLLMSNR